MDLTIDNRMQNLDWQLSKQCVLERIGMLHSTKQWSDCSFTVGYQEKVQVIINFGRNSADVIQILKERIVQLFEIVKYIYIFLILCFLVPKDDNKILNMKAIM